MGKAFGIEKREPKVDCWVCKRFDSTKGACAAFAGGIPRKIIEGEVLHDRSYRGDGGLTFKQRR